MAFTIQQRDEIFNEVIKLIEDGLSLRKAIIENGRCSRDTFNEWLKSDRELSDQYVTACTSRADALFEEIIEIADETSNDTLHTERGDVVNSEWIARSRLRVDARKWVVSKMNPKKYGDKTDVTSGGDKIQNNIPIQIEIVKPNED